MKNSYVWLLITLTALLTACGGGGGGDSTTGTNTGIAVDPYIVGAQFEEVSADGQTIQTSDASSEAGRFMFTNDISDGSIIRIKNGAEGLHANAPFTGVIKRRVSADDTGPVVVSPLTTLVANGMTPGAVVQMMTGAGFAGLTADRIFEDPMAGLVGQTGNVADGDLVLLQANLATHAFMAAIQDFNYGGVTTAAVTPVAFADCAAAVQDILNATTYQQLAGSLGADFTVGDMANAAVRVTRTVVDGIREAVVGGSQNVSSDMVDQLTTNAKMETETIAGNFYQSRTGGGGSTPPSADPSVGQSLFASNCVGCHTAGTGSGVMELAGDGGFVTSRFAGGSNHNGQTLTASQIADVSAYLDSLNVGTPPSTDPGTDPVTDRTGQQVFDQECASCHAMGSHNTSGSFGDLASMGSAIVPKIEGNHQGKTSAVTTGELTALADFADTFTVAPPVTDPGTGPVTDRTGQQVFDQECASCHAMGSHNTSGSFGDLASMGSAIVPKIEGNHQGKMSAVTTGELTALADFADTFTVAPPVTDPGTGPVTDRTGQQVFDQECASCHAMGSHDTSGSFGDLANMGSAIVPKIEGNHQGKTSAVTAAELTALADFAGTFTVEPGTQPPLACDTCHGYPETSGAHTVHLALNDVDCDSCHANNNHNDGWVDLNFPAEWDAASGPAMDNGDLTCSNIICHGGKQTPDWNNGSISVDSQCRSCHASGTSEFNSYSSGKHKKHVDDKNIACQTCHDPGKLGTIGHFTNLSTTDFEADPAESLQNALNFNGRSCSPNLSGCHGGESW